MNPAFPGAFLLLLACMGAAHVRSPSHAIALTIVLMVGLVGWTRMCGRTWSQLVLFGFLLCLVSTRCGMAAVPIPQVGDPSLLVPLDGPAPVVQLIGRVRADAPVHEHRCRALVEVSRIDGAIRHGRTELTIEACEDPLLEGAWIKARGPLTRPQPSAHPLFSDASRRLAAQACWSRLRTDSIRLLRQDTTPLADARRRITRRFIQAAGEQRGTLLSALVLGSAHVSLPEPLRDGFRVAGLSHALAASGFHLSVLLGTTLVCTRRWPTVFRLVAGSGAMVLFLVLAGAQASVVRAVLMGSAVLVIRESGHQSRPLGVLLITLVVMLLVSPSWARSIGFQFSGAATAGLVISAGPIEEWLRRFCPFPFFQLAPLLSVPVAALLWTLPLQLFHFGAVPLYAVLSNLLAAPLLAPLTLAAIGLALMVLLLPAAITSQVLPWLIWPVQQLAGALIALVLWIRHWPGAQLFAGRISAWQLALLLLACLPFVLPLVPRSRLRWCLVPLLLVVGVQAVGRLQDRWIHVEQWGRHWLLLRHRGRAALLTTHGDALSCHQAKRLSQGMGHQRLDWVAVLDPVGTDQRACWKALAHTLHAEQQGRFPLSKGQRLQSDGMSVAVADPHGRILRVQLGPRTQWLRRRDLRPVPVPTRGGSRWRPSTMRVRFMRMERWQSPVDCARLEIV